MAGLDHPSSDWQDLEGDACSSTRIGPQGTSMSNRPRQRDEDALHDSDGQPYSVSDMFRDIREMKKQVDKACAFIDGEKRDGSDSAKVRIDRLEQAHKAREAKSHLALAASLTALAGIVVAWIKWISTGGGSH